VSRRARSEGVAKSKSPIVASFTTSIWASGGRIICFVCICVNFRFLLTIHNELTYNIPGSQYVDKERNSFRWARVLQYLMLVFLARLCIPASVKYFSCIVL